MSPTTKPKIWPTDRPYVVFMVPAEHAIEYAFVANRLTANVLTNLGWGSDSIEMIGLTADTTQQVTEGILFLEESGIEPRKVTLLMLWGDTAEGANLQGRVPEECGLGAVILPSSGVILPTVRMPSLESGWWNDVDHVEFATAVFEDLIRDGRIELDGSEPSSFVAGINTWN